MRFFIDHERRMVRTTDDDDPRPPPRWSEVTAHQYDAFRKETKTFSVKELKKMRAPA